MFDSVDVLLASVSISSPYNGIACFGTAVGFRFSFCLAMESLLGFLTF
jgi:hypothetical protein